MGIMFFNGLILIAVNMTDNFRQTKDELTLFYTTSFDTCTLTKLEKRKYPGRGDYSIFYTDCASNYFPVLLEKNSPTESYNLFKENVKLTKTTNSVDVVLTADKVPHRVRIRNPEDEDDRAFSTKVILIFTGIAIALAILLPDRLFEKGIR
jgi:hypothetical protein